MNGLLNRRRLACLAAVLLVAGAAVAWWWPRYHLEPPMPQGIADNEVREAIELARQKVLGQPRSASAWGDLATVLFAHLFTDEADICFAEAARLAPYEPMWPYSRGVIARKRTPETAVALLEQALAACRPDSADRAAMALQLAEELLVRGNLDEAERLFRAEHDRSVPLMGNNSETKTARERAAFGLGLIAKSRGDTAAATKFMLQAHQSVYARKKTTSQLAALARLSGQLEAAERHERKAAELTEDPPWPDPILDQLLDFQVGKRGLQRRAGQLELQHRYQEAADMYLRQLAIEPSTETRISAAINLARLRNYDEALRLLREAVKLDPDAAHPHYALGHVLFARAEREWHENPGSDQVRDWFQEAAEQSRLAAQRRPDDARAYLFWGLSLKYLNKSAAAVEPLQKGVALAPADFDLQNSLGDVLAELGRDKDAEIHFHNAQRLKPADPRPAKALEKLGRKKTDEPRP